MEHIDYIERLITEESIVIENAIISVLDRRPRYLRRIPKMYYVRHFLEIHKQDSLPRIEKTEKGYSISNDIKVRIYDKIRRKYIKF